METTTEKNFTIETFVLKSERDARFQELRKKHGVVKFSTAKSAGSTWSVGYPIRLSGRPRTRDRKFPTGPSPKKHRRARYFRRHPQVSSFHVKQADGRVVAKNA